MAYMMPSAESPTAAAPLLMGLPDFAPTPTEKDGKTAHSAPDTNRRHSLPSHFLPTSLWSKNGPSTSASPSLVESEEAARGEHILDQASVANRISALRQLNGATRSGHRYAKSTGARNSTFSQPVIVRTYSGTIRPRSQQRDIITVKKENGMSNKSTSKVDLKLPPIEAFSFKGIMDEIRHGVTEDLERIAEICARSKYSLSNQYEVHMPPHGRGEPIIQTGASGSSTNGAGPTLQAIGSDDEQPRYQRSRGGRKSRSAAYGTLETIMSTSRSSDEDNSTKKPAAEIAEEVRGRAARKALPLSKDVEESAVDVEPGPRRPAKHVRSKSASFASMMIDSAHASKSNAGSQLVSPTTLISEPARPQTSTTIELENPPVFGNGLNGTTPLQVSSSKPAMIRNESSPSTIRPGVGNLPTIFENINSWLPWTKRQESVSHAEGSLRHLLKSADTDRKGKGIDRSG